MSTGAKGALAAVAVIGILAFIGIASYISANDTANSFEQRIAAIYEDNEQFLGQYGQKVQEVAQVPGMAAEDYTKLVQTAMSGRYGQDGSQANWQWIKEAMPSLPNDTYSKIANVIEAGRDDFTAKQTALADVKRAYRTNLGSAWSGFWMGKAGFPTIKIGFPIGTDDDYPVISTSRAQKAFQDGKEDGPIQLRN